MHKIKLNKRKLTVLLVVLAGGLAASFLAVAFFAGAFLAAALALVVDDVPVAACKYKS